MGAKVDITSECKIYSGPSIIMHANNYCEFTRERERENSRKRDLNAMMMAEIENCALTNIMMMMMMICCCCCSFKYNGQNLF